MDGACKATLRKISDRMPKVRCSTLSFKIQINIEVLIIDFARVDFPTALQYTCMQPSNERHRILFHVGDGMVRPDS
jgi:hypothetical protein